MGLNRGDIGVGLAEAAKSRLLKAANRALLRERTMARSFNTAPSAAKERPAATGGSGPDQQPAFDNAWGQLGCPDHRIDRLCITCCSPSQPRVSGAISFTPQARRVPVSLASGHHGPDHSCDLIGERDGRNLGRPLDEAPGVGPVLATALVAAVADPALRSERNFSELLFATTNGRFAPKAAIRNQME